MRLFWTSDQHINHANIIRLTNRPFSSIQEMNDDLVKRHNEVVGPEDIVWHLGDFSLNAKMVGEYLPRLNGEHHLVMGNHDACFPYGHKPKKVQKAQEYYLSCGFKSIQMDTVLDLPGLGNVFLSHFPYRDTDSDNRYEAIKPIDKGMLHLHGHCHNRWVRNGNQLNIGVDVHNYAPISLEQIIQIVKS